MRYKVCHVVLARGVLRLYSLVRAEVNTYSLQHQEFSQILNSNLIIEIHCENTDIPKLLAKRDPPPPLLHTAK